MKNNYSIGYKNTVLIADDDLIVRSMMVKIFEDGYRVLQAKDGVEALEILGREDVTAVILDLMMPNLDGYGVLSAMQKDPELKQIPVIVVTARNDEESQICVLDGGAQDVIVKPFNPEVVRHRISNIIQRRIADKQAEEYRIYEILLQQAEIDEKTGIYTKQAFIRKTTELLRENTGKQYLLCRWDIDRFKVYNDLFGSEAGDKILSEIGRAYLDDTLESVVIAGHLEADHFISCSDVTKFDEDKIIKQLESIVSKVNEDFGFIVRAGLYFIEDPYMDVSLMCDRALMALRSTKHNYTKRVARYDDSMIQHFIEEQELIMDMDDALENGEFIVYLQPQYDYEKGKMTGAEVLVRWQHPKRGLLMPGEFISIFEQNGFIWRMDEYVWEQACMLIRSWIDKELPIVPISINISRHDIYGSHPGDIIVELLNKYELKPSMLRLEVTESAFMQDPQKLVNTIEELKAKGFTVEMDDFGSGYSSLNTLKEVHVDTLKMDMKFLESGKDDSRAGKILSFVVRMASWLNLKIIAEGVETKEQADYLKSMGCLNMQGYYFAKPMPHDEFENLLVFGNINKDFNASQKMGEGSVDFLNASNQATLMFNSFVGGAQIVELRNGKVESLRVNDQFFKVTGFSREYYEKTQSNMAEFLFPESQQMFLETLYRAIETGEAEECEIHSMPSGNNTPEVWMQVRVRHLVSGNDNNIFYLAIDNISERKERDAMRAKAYARTQELEAALNAMSLFFWTYDLKTKRYSVVNANAARLGIGKIVDGRQIGLRTSGCVAEDGIELAEKRLAELISNISRSRNGTVILHMNREKSGMEWMRISYLVIRDKDGEAIAISFVGEDYSESRDNEIMYADALTGANQGETGNAFASVLVDVSQNTIEACRGTFINNEMTYEEAHEKLCRLVYTHKQRSEVFNKLNREAILNAFNSGNTSVSVEYQRYVGREKIPRWVRTVAKTFRESESGNVKSLHVSVDIDYEVISREMASVVARNNFELISLIYADSGYMRCYENSSLEEKMEIGVDCYYSQGIDEFIESFVQPEYRDEARETMGLNSIMETLNHKKIGIVTFPLILDGEKRYKQWRFCWLNNEKGAIVLSRADITEVWNMKQRKEEMELALRNMKTVVCYYDIAKRTLTMPEDYASRFDLPPIVMNVPYSSMGVVVGDKTGYVEFYERIIKGEPSGSIELQFTLKDGEPYWERLFFATKFDNNGKPLSAIITVNDITAQRNKEIEAERNRFILEQSGVALIDYDVKSDTLAFETVDKDNCTVKKTFKNYYSYVLNDKTVHKDSVETIRGIIRESREWPVSGKAEYKAKYWGDGYRWCRLSYKSLVDKGGNVYRVVGQINDIQNEKDKEILIADLKQHVQKDNIGDTYCYNSVAMLTVVKYLVDMAGSSEAINRVISFVGGLFDVDRVTIFEGNETHTECSQIYEWCAKGIDSSTGQRQGIPYDAIDSNFKKSLREKHIICCNNPSELPEGIREYLIKHGIRALLISALINDNELFGFMGFEYHSERLWSTEQVGSANIIGDLLTYSLYRLRENPEENFTKNLLSSIDNSSMCVYVVDPGSHRLLYSNTYMTETLGGIREGAVCHKELMGRDEPCETCPINNIDGKGRYNPVEIQRIDGCSMLAQASRFRWKEQDVYMVICTDLTGRVAIEDSLRISVEENAIVIKQSGKKACRYNIAADTLENMLDKRDVFGLSWKIENYSQVVVEKGIIAEQSVATHHRFIEEIRYGTPHGSCNVMVNTAENEKKWLHMDYSLVYNREGIPLHAVLSMYDNTDFVEKELAYERWNSNLNSILINKTPYMEANITADVVERYENLMLSRPENIPRKLTDFMEYAVSNVVVDDDADAFEKFFDCKRMLALFLSGTFQDSLNYRATFDGRTKWYRVDMQMVKYPYSEDIKAFITFNDIDENMREKERLTASADNDAMTNILNRGAMQRRVEKMIRKASALDRVAMFVVDMDSFKSINDTFGHQKGDEILIKMSGVLRSTFRGGDLVGRMGGDEFMAYMQKGATDGVVRRKATQLLSQMQFALGGVTTTVSIGIAVSAGGVIRFEHMYAAADKALYMAKGAGKNTFVIVDGSTGQEIEGRTSVPEDAVQLQMLLKSMDGGIIVSEVNKNQINIIYVSPSLDKYIEDVKGEEIVSENLFELIFPEDREKLKKILIDAATDGKRFDITFRVGREGERWFRVTGERLSNRGNGMQLIGVVSDMTRLIKAEKQLIQENQQPIPGAR